MKGAAGPQLRERSLTLACSQACVGQGEAAERAAAATMEVVISRILQAGVLLSAAAIGLGVLLWALTGHSGYSPGHYPVGLEAPLRDALALRPLAVVQVGLGILMLTPVVRVAASVLLFWRERDWTYVTITATVLAMLIASLALGAAAH